jgi:hypothetical protein
MRRLLFIRKCIFCIVCLTVFSQLNVNAQQNVGIGTLTPNPKAILEMVANDKGLLIPRLTNAQMLAIATSPTEDGLLVYNTTQNTFCYWQNVSASWVCFGDGDNFFSGCTV